MPTTRRKRANPPEQPEQAENNNHLETQPSEVIAEALPTEQQASLEHEPHATQTGASVEASTSSSEVHTDSSSQPSAAPTLPTPPAPTSPSAQTKVTAPAPVAVQVAPAQTAAMNGNSERMERNEQDANTPPPSSPSPVAPPFIEGGRRTARGELFRRPPQPPLAQQVPVPHAPVNSTAPMQAPTHEITLPLGKRPGDTNGDPLHLAYNPGYTGSDEARSILLHNLSQNGRRRIPSERRCAA